MLCIWADTLVRISGGLAILLLLAAEEKVCPWLLTPPSEPPIVDDESGPGRDAGSQLPNHRPEADPGNQEPSGDRPVPLSLTSMLPDAVPVRRSVPLNRATQEETAGWRDGTVACGPLLVSPGGGAPAAPADATPGWPIPAPRAPVDAIQPRTGAPPVRDPAVTTILLRTGPPRS